ncbi:class I SAM-dependent methyltransferase [Flexivirga caeni]|uniref:Class I SAM-dependent methyltransferase n=1 Tax=Flexivirga caeni TaxID=2294115 RepID=A0A3M9M6Z4_9MICO|nr:class I SAM-dependent methyltransferase [Flexivirga caeni]RNI20653.1 class I SAM-dependent methyltransferase [Flexivirga caeni]
MSDSRSSGGRPSYGIDAPYVPIIFLIVAVVFIAGAAAGVAVWWVALIGVFFLAQAICYLHATLRGKHTAWSRLLDGLHLTGGEQVLDLGCGRGAVLLAAAGRLTTGHAHGLDLWRSQDQSGNSPDVTRANAVALGVADRVDLDTGDMTQLPYPDGTFDVVVSSLAIHNIRDVEGRFRVLDEALRVLRPGGRLVVADIRTVRRYANHLRSVGAAEVTVRGLGPGFWFGGPWQATSVVTATKPAG